MSTISKLTQIAKGEIGNNGSKYRKWFYNRTSDYIGVGWQPESKEKATSDGNR